MRFVPLLLFVFGALLTSAAELDEGGRVDVLDQALLEAERALRQGETQIAESRYRTALYEGFLRLGRLELASGDPAAARRAFERAATVAVEQRRALLALALVELDGGQAGRAVEILQGLLARMPGDLEARQLLARALAADGKTEEGAQELAAVLAAAPEDLEILFSLATAHLRAENPAKAEELFIRLAEARPIPQTWVLIGRTWRDFSHFERAREALQKSLELDPQTRRAHYYLGSVELLEEGRARLEEAIAHFDAELEVAPDDATTHLFRGLALVEARRFEEALEPLENASREPATRLDALHFLGRAQLRLGRLEDAEATLRRALEVAAEPGLAPGDDQLSSLHYQLAQTLRQRGDAAGAKHHFAAAEGHSADLTENLRQDLDRYLDEETTTSHSGPGLGLGAAIDVSALAALPEDERASLRENLATVLARAHLNLGILRLRTAASGSAEPLRFSRAAELLAVAAELDADLPGVQYTLAVALFNAGEHAAALAPLENARQERPQDAALTRMLALSRLETEDWAGAAELLAEDPARRGDPSLQYAYGVALVRGGRAALAERIFADLLRDHDDWPQLHVVLGQAYAEQDDYPAAITALEHALELSEAVAGAHGALGLIYLRHGRLDEAEAALSAELEAHPTDVRARYHLATVLDLNRRPEAAEAMVRELLEAVPGHADGRYLLGKLLLARGAEKEAARELEIAAELSPKEPQIRYQLGQAYQKLGRAERARAEFEAFRTLKREARGDGP